MSSQSISSSQWELLSVKMPYAESDITAVGLSSQGVLILVGREMLHAFDAHSRVWNTLPSMTIQRYGSCAAVSRHNTVYVMGGYNDMVLGETECLHLDSKMRKEDHRWERLPTMMTRRNYCTAAIAGDCIFIIGGSDGTCLQSIEMFHAKRRTWSRLPDMAQCRSGCVAGAGDNGKIYVFGGRDGSKYLDTAEAFDLKTSKWESLPYMPCSRSYGAAVVVGRFILLLGGRNEKKRLDEVHCFDTMANRWVPGTRRLNTARSHCGAAYIHGQVFVFGGVDQTGCKLDTIEKMSLAPSEKSNNWSNHVFVPPTPAQFETSSRPPVRDATPSRTQPSPPQAQISSAASQTTSSNSRPLQVSMVLPSLRPPSIPDTPVDTGHGRSALRNWAQNVQCIKQSFLNKLDSEAIQVQEQHDTKRKGVLKYIQEANRILQRLDQDFNSWNDQREVMKNNWIADVDDQLMDAQDQGASFVTDHGSLDDIPSHLVCPISRELMADPVVAADGHTYSRDAIEQWFALAISDNNVIRSPLTNAVLEHSMLTPNLAIRSQVRDFQETSRDW